MKRLSPHFFFCVSVLFLLSPQHGYSQSKATPTRDKPDQEQVIQELLSEVRQLRMALQRVSVNAYRAQVTLERLRLQQEQVTRLSQELNKARSQIVELKASRSSLKEKMEDLEQRKERGLAAESEVKAVQAVMEELKQREENLIERETELSVELSTEQVKLDDLNKRLDALEREVVMTGINKEGKQNIKQRQD